jgi:hypothetical protein
MNRRSPTHIRPRGARRIRAIEGRHEFPAAENDIDCCKYCRFGLGLSLVTKTLTLVGWGSISGTWNRSELRPAIHQSWNALWVGLSRDEFPISGVRRERGVLCI